MLYADASALVKLVLAEPETDALIAYLEDRPTRLATSVVAEVEIDRAARSAGGDEREDDLVDRVLGQCMRLALDARIRDAARRMEPVGLRTLDAVHLASALFLETHTMLVYDRRLGLAAESAGLEVLAPGA